MMHRHHYLSPDHLPGLMSVHPHPSELHPSPPSSSVLGCENPHLISGDYFVHLVTFVFSKSTVGDLLELNVDLSERRLEKPS
jgi:hypothetical protein